MNIKVIKKTQFNCYDMEQLRDTVKGSDFKHIQLSNGQFCGQNKQLMLENSIICSGVYNQKILVQGTFPKDMLTFGLILSDSEAGVLSGLNLKRGDLVFFPENAELHYLIPKDTVWLTFNIARQHLEQYDLDFSFNTARIIRPLTHEFFSLTSLMEDLYRDESRFNAVEAEESIIEFILENIRMDSLKGLKEKRIQLSTKAQILTKANSYINDNLTSVIKVSDLLNEFNSSHRTINYVFKETLHMSLKQYIKKSKLNTLRTLLQSPLNQHKSIKEMAEYCGLTHMGRVAQEYRILFSENPNETRFKKHKK